MKILVLGDVMGASGRKVIANKLPELIKKNKWKPGSKIIAIHTGALQGIASINSKLKNKQLQTLSYSK